MIGKEAKQRLSVLISEIESKKTELDTVLISANQIKGQLDTISNDLNSKQGVISTVESDVNNKLGTVTKILQDITQKQTETNKIVETVNKSQTQIEEAKKNSKNFLNYTKNIQNRSEELLNQIETELKAGATSANLSKSFADKVNEYKKNSRFWSVCFIVWMIIIVGYYGFVTFYSDQIQTTQDVWRHLAFRSPFLVFGVWLAIFFGNRRAESKKLEESYKHKEVMARSFVGYKQTLESLGDEDKILLKQHMANLLKAMDENSASFLNSEGDKHPVFEVLSFLFKPKK